MERFASPFWHANLLLLRPWEAVGRPRRVSRGALLAGPIWLGSAGQEDLQKVSGRGYLWGPSDAQVSQGDAMEGCGQQQRAVDHGVVLYVM